MPPGQHALAKRMQPWVISDVPPGYRFPSRNTKISRLETFSHPRCSPTNTSTPFFCRAVSKVQDCNAATVQRPLLIPPRPCQSLSLSLSRFGSMPFSYKVRNPDVHQTNSRISTSFHACCRQITPHPSSANSTSKPSSQHHPDVTADQ